MTESTAGPPGTSDEALSDRLVSVAFATTAAMTKVGAAHDLSFTMVRVLGLLRDRRRCVSELADHLGLEKQTLSGLLSRAAKRRLVIRMPNEMDRRVTDVTLSSEGAALVTSVRAEGQVALAPLLKGLDAGDRNELVRILERMMVQ